RPGRGRLSGRAVGAAALTMGGMPDARPRVFVSRRIMPEGLDLLANEVDVDLWPEELPPDRAELLRRVGGIDGLLSMLTERVDDELLDAAGPQLRGVSNYAVGFDNVDVGACCRRGVAVGKTPRGLPEAARGRGLALLVASSR